MTMLHKHNDLQTFDAILALEPTALVVNGNSVDLDDPEPWRRLVDSAGVSWFRALLDDGAVIAGRYT